MIMPHVYCITVAEEGNESWGPHISNDFLLQNVLVESLKI